jgi:hypothetical protein
MVVISFVQMFWDMGLAKALVQTWEDPRTAANVVFWTNVAPGVILYAILLVTAPCLAGPLHGASSVRGAAPGLIPGAFMIKQRPRCSAKDARANH